MWREYFTAVAKGLMKHFQHVCFPLEFICRIIIVKGGKVKKNKMSESFMVFSDKQQLY